MLAKGSFKILFLLILSFSAGISFGQNDEINKDTPLLVAIIGGNIEKVKELISNGADVNEENGQGISPVEVAIRVDKIDIVKLLLSKGVTDRWGMQYAVRNNNASMVRLLINNEFDFGYSLVYAAENNNLSMVEMLVRNGSKVRISQKRKKGLFRKYYVSPIGIAVENGNKAMVNFLIEHGAPLSEAIEEAFIHEQDGVLKSLIDKNSDYAIFIEPAFQHSNMVIVEYVVSKGGKIDNLTSNGNSMLHIAATKGDLNLTRYCVEDHKLDVNATNTLGETPLMYAVKANKMSLVNYLIDRGAKVEAENNKGETALFYSISNNLNMFNLLVQKGADVSHRSADSTTLLINSARNQNLIVVQLLLDSGAKIDDVNDQGYSAFQYLISPHNRNRELIYAFIDKGADINTGDAKSGKSLMYYAIERERLKQIKELAKLGAKVNVLDRAGNRPRVNDAIIIKYIIENGADINALDSRHDSYICVAVKEKNLELARFLVSKGIDVNQNCYFAEPPVIKAIEDGNLAFVQFLADNGADLDAVGYFERNVMDYADRKGDQKIIDFLKSRGAMTKNDRAELYRKSKGMELEISLAVTQKNEEQLVSLLKQTKGLIIQNRIVERVAVFGAEEGNPIIAELLLTNLKFDINEQINEFNQNMLMIATINDETSLVSYLISKGCNTEMFDSKGKLANDYAESKAMKKIYNSLK